MKTLGILATCLALGLLALYVALDSGGSGGRGDDGTDVGPTLDTAPDVVDDSTNEGTGIRSALPDPAAPPTPSTQSSERSSVEALERATTPAVEQFLRLEGVILGESGPIRGAHVFISARGERVADVNSNRNGEFQLEVPVPAHDVVLRVVARGYAGYARDLGERPVGSTQSLGNVFLRRGTVLAGTVVDPRGRPVHGARVTLNTLDGAARRGIGEDTTTGVDGRFEFPTAPAGRLTLTAFAETYAEATLEHRHTPGSEALIRLSPGVDLSVRVVDGSGKPIEGADVTIRSASTSAAPRTERSDGEGRVRFAGLSDPEWNLRSIAPGHKPGSIHSVEAGGPEVRLELAAWPCAVGRVLKPDGEPAPAGTRIHAIPNAARGDMIRELPGGAIVDAAGGFRACDLRPGQYKLLAFAPGYATSESSPFRVVDQGDVEVGALYLKEGGHLTLAFRSGTEAVSGVRVELLSSAPLPAQVWSDPRLGTTTIPPSNSKGVIRLTNLSTGLAWLIARDDRLVPTALGPYSIVEGQTTEPAVVQLQAGARIAGRTKTEGGSAVPRARLTIRGGDVVVPYIQSENDGSFVSPPLPPGIYSLEGTSVIGGELARADPLDVRLAAGETKEIDVVLRTQ